LEFLGAATDSTFNKINSQDFNLNYVIFFLDNDSLKFKKATEGRVKEEFKVPLYYIGDYNGVSKIPKDLLFKVVIDGFTKNLLEKEGSYFKVYNPDFLIMVISWADKFKYWAELSGNNDVFYEAISYYWFNEVALRLTAYVKDEPSLTNSFKFKFLLEKCSQNNFLVNIPETSVEKLQKNFFKGNFKHLISASWSDIKIWQKIVFLVFVMFTASSYIYFILYLVKLKSLK
jgi:hypothetical protein